MMDILKKKGNMIFWGLVALVVFCSIWGSVNSRSAKTLKLELDTLKATIETQKQEQQKAEVVAAEPTVGVEEARIEELEALVAALQEKEENMKPIVGQLKKARTELVAFRKKTKQYQAMLSQQTGELEEYKKTVNTKGKETKAQADELKELKKAIALVNQEMKDQAAKIEELNLATAQQTEENKAMKQGLEEAQQAAAVALKQEAETVAEATSMVEAMQAENETFRAQVIGLEKMVEEKSLAFDETSRKLDRMKINMDVLLSEIASQKGLLQELAEENEELVKDLTVKNKQLVDLQAQQEQAPVQE